ncbi:MAG: YggS family pyridoxal phosphate-dependent enzyme [Saprospiraceae bacterium]|nr:YggS family pyridoxal phosphate-dependent enzyme [Saprospiraceae bacterium]
MVDSLKYYELKNIAEKHQAKLLVVTKNQIDEDILKLYELGQRAFAENKVQHLIKRHENLPKDIEWHMIGHLQKNKIKFLTEWVHCIQSVDSFSLAKEINLQASQLNRVIPIFLEMKIATELTKYGFDKTSLLSSLKNDAWEQFSNLQICGLMGMASFTTDTHLIQKEFSELRLIFEQIKPYIQNHTLFTQISMGMSGDYAIALEEGSTMIRIGSLLFR